MAIKKTMTAIHALLEANKENTVESIFEEATALCSTKSRAKGDGTGMTSTFIKDATGTTVAVFDYYFKRWMPLVGDEAVEFGAKASAASGYASMSKAGVSHWTKQQREAKKALANILARVESGDLAPSDITDAKEAIEVERKVIVETEAGFATREEVMEYLADNCDMPEAEDS